MRLITGLIVLLLLLLSPSSAHAYVGPGVGAGSIAVVVGIIGSILLAIFAVVWYPLKRFFKSRKKNANSGKSTANKGPSEG